MKKPVLTNVTGRKSRITTWTAGMPRAQTAAAEEVVSTERGPRPWIGPAVSRLVCSRLHGAGLGGRRHDRGLAGARRSRCLSLVVHPDGHRHDCGLDRRRSGPTRSHQGSGAQLRRPPLGQPGQLSELHLPSPALGVRARLLPDGYDAWLLLPLVASAYGFCQVEAKTADGFFLGFPSLWNVVALYLYILPTGSWMALTIVVVLAILTFVPTRHLYPSQPGSLNRAAMILGLVWTVFLVWIVWDLPRSSEIHQSASTLRLAYLSLFYPVFYLGTSWAISLVHWKKQLLGKRKPPRDAPLDATSRLSEV